MAASLVVQPEYASLVESLGLADVKSFFADPRIKVWRDTHDRQNATLDAAHNNKPIRLHIKRDARRVRTPLALEAHGVSLLHHAEIATVPLVAHGYLEDGRSFVASEDLTGFAPADVLLREKRNSFDDLLEPTARLAARLHQAGLHHRDLYLAHFFANDQRDLRLIDVARVRPIPWLFPTRWIVKDLAQFWYSTIEHGIVDAQRDEWLDTYQRARGLANTAAFRKKIVAKSSWIARHDASLRKREPNRNVSIPRGAL